MAHLAKALFHDDLSRFQITIESLHEVIHRGVAFTFSEIRAVNNGASNNTLILTGANNPHFRYYIGSDRGPINIFLFEGTVVNNNGTALTIFNAARNANILPTASLFNNPTIANDGTQIDVGIIPGTVSNRTGAPRDLPFFEWILRANTRYMLRTTNGSGAQADINLNFFWYEQ
jgi:hypothetical protein